ncbi:cation:proton antiporter [Streptomyces tendae]|uniref:cation:proton antiporter n=1 Tax=Streptomyces tendae TaxID=1932 RepID=UPI0036B5CD50
MLAYVPVPSLSSHQLLLFLLQVSLLLLMARALGWLANRVGMPAVAGELLVGVVLGPSLLGNVGPASQEWLFPPTPSQAHLLDALCQFAVILLVGVTGAHIDVKAVRTRMGTVVRVGLGALLVPLAAGIGVGFAFAPTLAPGDAERPLFALFLGVALCVSAIPVIAKTLSDMGLLHRDVGQLTLAAGMFDDAAGWLLLTVVSATATTTAGGSLALRMAGLAGFLLLVRLVGLRVVRAVLRRSAASAEQGPVLASAVVVVLLGAAATQALGLEAVFGAFVAGVCVGTAGPEVRARLAPLRAVVLSVLAPVFLAAAGLRIDLTALADPPVLLSAFVVLVVAVAGKFLGAYLGAYTSRLPHWEGIALGAGLNARGVVEIVVATVGLQIDILNTTSYTVVVLVAVSTSLMAPPVLRLAMRRVEQSAEEGLRAREYAQDWSTDRASPAPSTES